MKIANKKPKYYFLGDFDFTTPAIYISNHSKATGPIQTELHFPVDYRCWGTHEMATTFKKRYNYLVNTFFHVGWKIKSKFICHFFTWIAIPFVTFFYKQTKVIPTYQDNRLISTFKESIKVLTEEKESIYIFPEDISNGYYDEITYVHSGFYILGERCLKKGLDLPIYLMHIQRKKKRVIVDKPIMFSELAKTTKSKDDASKMLKDRINEIAKFSEEQITEQTVTIATYH